MKPKLILWCSVIALVVLNSRAFAQHLWWHPQDQKDATCAYGQVTVLATNPGIYYCGVNWHPGEPAGGYCGIQHNGVDERRTIFSIWDTSPDLHPRVTEAGKDTDIGHFGGEGTGAHTHVVLKWKVGETFQFFVQKQPGTAPDTTDTRYYYFDNDNKCWIHEATISNPNGGKPDVSTIAGGLNSFLENFVGKDRAVPKLATYRLWLGTAPDAMKCVTHAGGDGKWGQLHDAYFLAEGDPAALADVFSKVEDKYGKPTFGAKGVQLPAIADEPLATELVEQLKHLPRAAAVPTTRESEPETKAQRDKRMAWWRDSRFGMFIHWGLYAVPAGEWNGKPIGNCGEWIMRWCNIPVADYAKLAEQFNPVKYDAEKWVLAAKDAGVKYIVITAKHHEGFAMFKTAVDKYNIVDATPYKHDPLKDLVDACRRHDIKIGFYYSQNLDWHHPGGGTAGARWDKAQEGAPMYT